MQSSEIMESLGQDKVHSLLKEAEDLQLKVSKNIVQCPGATKLLNKIIAEKRFLQGLKSGSTALKKNHLTSSNLKNLAAIVDCVEEAGTENVTSLLERFHGACVSSQEAYFPQKPSLCVDIVAKQGKLWVKVIARNAQSILATAQGQGQYGEKTVLDIAEHYQSVAKENLIDFEVPAILYKFANGVPSFVAQELTKMGIFVDGEVLHDSDEALASPHTVTVKDLVKPKFDNASSEKIGLLSLEHCPRRKANLDITAMICFVSNLTNSHNTFTYGQPVLDQQATEERSSPALPKLKEFLHDKELIACQTAVDSFKEIVATIGGENEKKRSDELMRRVKTVDDNPSERTLNLNSTRTLNTRAKILFGTGDSEKAVTVTANTGFVRAAKQSGVIYSVFLHEARALTETKEKQ